MEKEKLMALSKEDLVKMVQNLQGGKGKKDKSKKKAKKAFDSSQYAKRFVALQVAYLGWDYHGFASQPHNENTVEGHLHRALQKTCLCLDRESSHYSRCGRTDKGVSALGQVIAMHMRSAKKEPGKLIARPNIPQPLTKEELNDVETELPYALCLNQVLPKDIRVLGWATVPEGFNSRFNCIYRSYKYFFVRGNLNIQRMKEAANDYVGNHDFRNFCKMDVTAVHNFKRRMLNVSIEPVEEGEMDPSNEHMRMYVFNVKGHAFLWHQIRYMVAVLFAVGHGYEDSGVVKRLLNQEEKIGKPSYAMASEEGLLLYKCGFENVHFNYLPKSQSMVLGVLDQVWTSFMVRASMTRTVSLYLLDAFVPTPSACETEDALILWKDIPLDIRQTFKRNTKYTKLEKRRREETYEERMANLKKKAV